MSAPASDKSAQDRPRRPAARSRRLWWILAFGAIGVVLLLAAGAAVYYLGRTTYWTDDRGMVVPDDRASVRHVLWSEPEPMSALLNTAGQEYEPAMSGDETELFFVRGMPAAGADIWVSRRQGDAWAPPKPLDAVNTPHDELGPRLTPDGRFLLFYSNRPGGQGGYDIWAARRTADGWEAPANLGEAINGPYNEYNPACDPDGRLVFTTNRKAAAKTAGRAWRATIREARGGDYDLFIADPSPVTATSPAATAPAAATALRFAAARELAGVNTTSYEGACCVSPSGDFLYFASDRPGGQGGFDLYRCRIRDDECTRLENLGPAVNTPHNEIDPHLALGGYRLYFSSDRAGGDDPYDLYACTSHEVYAHRRGRPLPTLGWQVWVLVIGLALLAPLLLFLRAGGYRHLNLLQKCLFISLAIHVLFMILSGSWWLYRPILMHIAKEAGMEIAVNLEISREFEIAQQVRQQITDVPVPERLPTDLQAARLPEPAREVVLPKEAPPPKIVNRPAAMDIQPETITPPRPAPSEEMPLPPPEPDLYEPSIDLNRPKLTAVEVPEPAVPAPPMRRATKAQPEAPAPRAEAFEIRAARARPEADSLANVRPPDAPKPQPARAERITSDVRPDDVRVDLAGPTMPAGKPVFQRTTQPSPDVTLIAQRLSPASSPARPAVAGIRLAPSPTTMAARSVLTASPTTQPVARATQKAPMDSPSVEAVQVAVSGPKAPAAPVATRPAEPDAPETPVRIVQAPTGPPRAPTSYTNAAVTPARTANRSMLTTTRPAPVRAPARADAPRPAAPPAEDLAVRLLAPSARVGSQADPVVTGPVQPPRPSQAARVKSPGPPRPADQVQTPPAVGAPADGAPSLVDQPLAKPRRPRQAEIVDRRAVPHAPVSPLGGGLGPGRLRSPDSFRHRSYEQRQKFLRELGGSKKSEAAVARALKYLAGHQKKDGRWSQLGGSSPAQQVETGVTGLVLLSFMGSDHTSHKDGPYRQAVKRGLDFLVSQQKPDGDLRGRGRMYAQAIATLALAEAAIMTGDATYRQAAAKGAAFIVKAQNPQTGGWRYVPGQAGDTSVVGWQVMALRSVERLGYKFPDRTRQGAARWLDYVSRSRHRMIAGYTNASPRPSMTAEAFYTRILLGQKLSPEQVKEGCDYLLANPPDKGPKNYYYWYYASLALMQVQNDAWTKWNAKMRDLLIRQQRTTGPHSGSWDATSHYGRRAGILYTTALSTLTLEVYYRYLPMYKSPDTEPKK